MADVDDEDEITQHKAQHLKEAKVEREINIYGAVLFLIAIAVFGLKWVHVDSATDERHPSTAISCSTNDYMVVNTEARYVVDHNAV